MKTIIVYATMSGQTEQIAWMIAKQLAEYGDDVVVKEALEAYAAELVSYERILIGSYTWGDGDLPDELLDFHEELRNTDLSGKIGAVFGVGDSTYTHFARAVDVLETTLTQQGCSILQKGLKVDQANDSELEEECKDFISTLLTQN